MKIGSWVRPVRSISFELHGVAGRLHTVASGNDTFTYAYEADSFGLIDTVTGPVHVVDNPWEANRDLLDTRVSDNSLVSAFDCKRYPTHPP